jgi:hypothetical protein
MVTKVVMDSNEKFIDVLIGLLGSVNDSIFFKKGLDCINKFNTMFCFIQIRDVEIEL